MTDYAYGKQWRLDRARGLDRVVDATPARRQVDTLIGQGWSLRAIAGAAGIAPQTVMRIRDGIPRTNRRIADAVLAIPTDAIPTRPSTQTTEPFVPRVGSVRRIQALIFMGWPHHTMKARTGVRTHVLLSQQGRWVTRTTHDKIAAIYDELAMTPGPSNRSRGWALKLGYVGPLAWDDIDRDEAPIVDGDDEAHLDDIAIARRTAGDTTVRLTKAEAAELVRRWRVTGRSLAECERVTGIKAERHLLLRDEEAS